MADFTILRAYFGDCTLGRIMVPAVPSFYLASLELPHKGNAQGLSCIPEGVYPYRVAPSPRHGRPVVWIDDVPGRTAIQGHGGNFTRQIEGCFLPGDGVKDLDKDGTPDVTNSWASLDRLIAAIPEKGTARFAAAEKPGRGVYTWR